MTTNSQQPPPIFSYHDPKNRYCSEKCFCLWAMFVSLLDNEKCTCECGAKLYFKKVELMIHPKGIDVPNYAQKRIPFVICSNCNIVWSVYKIVKRFGDL